MVYAYARYNNQRWRDRDGETREEKNKNVDTSTRIKWIE